MTADAVAVLPVNAAPDTVRLPVLYMPPPSLALLLVSDVVSLTAIVPALKSPPPSALGRVAADGDVGQRDCAAVYVVQAAAIATGRVAADGAVGQRGRDAGAPFQKGLNWRSLPPLDEALLPVNVLPDTVTPVPFPPNS